LLQLIDQQCKWQTKMFYNIDTNCQHYSCTDPYKHFFYIKFVSFVLAYFSTALIYTCKNFYMVATMLRGFFESKRSFFCFNFFGNHKKSEKGFPEWGVPICKITDIITID
jgi:hypothetical protein